MTNENVVRNVNNTLSSPQLSPLPNPIQKELILIENYISGDSSGSTTSKKINDGFELLVHQKKDIDNFNNKLQNLNMEIDKKNGNIKELELVFNSIYII